MSWEIFWNAIAIILIGVGIRFATTLVLSLFTRFDAKEKLFISICFFPKASVQAALAPLIFQYQTFDSTSEHMQTIFQTCVLSILITASIGQLMIELFGKVLLKKHVEVAKRNMGKFELFESFIVIYRSASFTTFFDPEIWRGTRTKFPYFRRR